MTQDADTVAVPYTCACDGCWACGGKKYGCTCDVDWDKVYDREVRYSSPGTFGTARIDGPES